GTQIQATIFKEAAKKFHDIFQMGKVYYISNGTLKVANKRSNPVPNDYEMTLNENSIVEEVSNVIGVVQNVSPTMSIRSKINNEMIPKRDITIADESKKTVVVSLWNDHATTLGQELLHMADKSPIVAIKSVKV
ncbi:Replication protein A 70 kDa DNA-binding subunit B, partial [Bienertia sinuspersici]